MAQWREGGAEISSRKNCLKVEIGWIGLFTLFRLQKMDTMDTAQATQREVYPLCAESVQTWNSLS